MARLSNESPSVAFYAISVACILIAQVLAYVAASFDFPSALSWLAMISFLVQWGVFIPSAFFQTAAYFDVAGPGGHFVLGLWSLMNHGTYHTRQTLVTLCVLVWSARLAMFLYNRIQRAGGDSRFDAIKQHGPRFFNMWTIQALWVFVVSLPVMCLNSTRDNPSLGWLDYLGLSLWAVGFGLEVIADAQKNAHNADPATKNTFISTGVWKYSRHPNYFGEITLWVGILLVCSSVFSGGQWVSVCSPLFVSYLLLKVSGIPLLEEKAETKWGLDPEYIAYVQRTPKLIPNLFVETVEPEKSELGEPLASKSKQEAAEPEV